MKYEDAIKQAVNHVSTSDTLIEFLKEAELSKIDSIKAYREIMNVPLYDAKKIVHFSKAWAFRKENDERLHEEIEELIKAGTSHRP